MNIKDIVTKDFEQNLSQGISTFVLEVTLSKTNAYSALMLLEQYSPAVCPTNEDDARRENLILVVELNNINKIDAVCSLLQCFDNFTVIDYFWDLSTRLWIGKR